MFRRNPVLPSNTKVLLYFDPLLLCTPIKARTPVYANSTKPWQLARKIRCLASTSLDKDEDRACYTLLTVEARLVNLPILYQKN